MSGLCFRDKIYSTTMLELFSGSTELLWLAIEATSLTLMYKLVLYVCKIYCDENGLEEDSPKLKV